MAENDAVEAMEAWLTERLAVLLRLEQGSIRPDAPFSEYGLDSLDAVTLAYDLEELLDVELPPTLLWDQPSVRECASYLVETSDVSPVVRLASSA